LKENVFKYLALFFFFMVIWSFCRGPEESVQNGDVYDVTVQTLTPASEGLDLRAVGALLKKAKDAETLEKLLNDPKEGVNNLDLNGDGQVDYIKVTEYGNGNIRGFALSTEPARGEEQEIATIEVEKSGDKANVEIQGNEQIYGTRQYYHSSFGLTDFLIMSYLFSPHRFYMSPWNYGYYPGYYQPWRTADYNRYRHRVSQYSKSAGFRFSRTESVKSPVTSPKAGKTASHVRAPLKNPTKSQKSFQARTRQTRRSGGFGRSSSVRRGASSRSGGFRSGK